MLYLGLVAILSAGVGAILRDTAATIAAVLAILYAAPILGIFVHQPGLAAPPAPVRPDWTRAWRSSRPGASPRSRSAAGPGSGVLAGYAAVTVLAGALLFRWRDA